MTLADSKPLTPKHWLAVLAIPTSLLLLVCVLSFLKGPFWLSNNLDPDYAYLLNGLNLAEGKLPGHVDHPGTPVQISASWIIRAVATANGNGSLDARRHDVLTRPEIYLGWCARIFTLLFLVALTVAGALTLWFTRALIPALAAQASALLATQVPFALTCVKPEPILATLSVCVGTVTILHLFGNFRHKDGRAALLYGTFIGLGIASKLTFIPLIVIPLIVLHGILPRVLCAMTAFCAFYLATLPIHMLFDTMMDWFTKLVTHSGQYGNGKPGMIDPLAYIRGLGSVLIMELPFTLLIIGSAILLAVSRTGESSDHVKASRRSLLAVLVAEVLQLLMVAKHPWNGAHYLVPGLGLIGANLLLVLQIVQNLTRERARFLAQRFLAGAVLCAGLFQCVQFFWLGAQLRNYWRQSERVDEFISTIPNAKVAGYYSCSSEAYALQFGNRFAVANYSETLMALRPDTIFYHQWFGMFTTYRGGIPDAEIAAQAQNGTLLLRGWRLGPDAVPSAKFPDGSRLELLFETPVECVYRVTAWPEK